MIKSKKCDIEDCNNPRFAKGYCKNHQSLRTDKRPKALKKITEKGKVKKELKHKLVQNDMSFYLSVWMNKVHVCEECKKPLEGKPKLYNFDHLLEKQSYPQLRHVEENIQLLCLQCHSTKTNGIHSPRMKNIIQKLKDKYLCDTPTEILKQDDLQEF